MQPTLESGVQKRGAGQRVHPVTSRDQDCQNSQQSALRLFGIQTIFTIDGQSVIVALGC